jgi:hypothetical protein
MHGPAFPRRYLLSLTAGAGMFAAVYVIDAFLASAGYHAEATFLDDILLGILVATLVFYLQTHHERQLRAKEEKLIILHDMNHYVRNALQAIVNAAYHSSDQFMAGQIQQAVNRIEWALREVLPGDSPREENSAAVQPKKRT